MLVQKVLANEDQQQCGQTNANKRTIQKLKVDFRNLTTKEASKTKDFF